MDWDIADFGVFGALLLGAGVTYAVAARMTGNTAYRAAAAAVAVAASFTLVWVNLAVGIIGSEDDAANLIFGGVLAVGIVGAIMARLQPHGMARAMLATALAQALVAVVALIAGLGATGPIWPRDILGVTGFLVALWLLSAWLFRSAARERTPGRAGPETT